MGIVTVMCKNCGFVFTNPRPVWKEMVKFYENTYRKFYFDQTDDPEKEFNNDSISKRAQWLYDFVEPEIKKLKIHDPSILDVGCGAGVLLYMFRSNMPKSRLYGVEPELSYAKYTEEKNNAVVYCKSLESFIEEQQELTGSFHLIILSHVLEHLYSPVDILLKLREFLTPEGLLLVEVPNMLSPHWSDPLHMFHIAHVNHFSPAVLKYVFALSGLKIVGEFSGKHPIAPWAMAYICRKTETIIPKKDIPVLTDQEFKLIYSLIFDKVNKEVKLDILYKKSPEGKSPITRLFQHYKEYGIVHTLDKMIEFTERTKCTKN